MKAYIINRENGTVQIGNTLYQPCTGKCFDVYPLKNKKEYCSYEVEDKSFQSANSVIRQDELAGGWKDRPRA